MMQSLASIAVVHPNLKFQVQVVLMMYTGPVWHDNAAHFLSTWYKCFNLARLCEGFWQEASHPCSFNSTHHIHSLHVASPKVMECRATVKTKCA